MSQTSLPSELWKACAEPWKTVTMLRGKPIALSALRMALTPPQSETPGARSKEIEYEGNWPRWSICSGAVWTEVAAMALKGTWPPPADGREIEENESSEVCRSLSASRMTRYWFDWVKMVETMRWPKAS